MLRAVAALLLVAALPSAADVLVRYDQPEKFIDFRLSYAPHAREIEMLTASLTRHLRASAEARIAPRAHLEVLISDVDMAGTFQQTAPPQMAAVRMIGDGQPARIHLDFRLTDENGKILKEGGRQLRSSALMQGLNPLDSDPLRYEKALLDDWLDREFPTPRRAAANANR